MSGEKKVTIQAKNFNLNQIWESGQCFRMRPLDDGKYYVIAHDQYLEMEQQGNLVTLYCSQSEFDELWKDYFDLGTDYEKWINSVDKSDTYLQEAVRFGSGVRILRQDVWEMVISFIISQQNNIKRIRKCIDCICGAYGTHVMLPNGTEYDCFPTPKQLASATEEELRELNLGYRAKYLVKTAKSVAEGQVKLDKLCQCDQKSSDTQNNQSLQMAREELLGLTGVGIKVADCICLFGLYKLDAFPIDTHIKKVLQEHYPDGFPMERYKGYAGVMQQYIFYYDLCGNS